MNDKSILYQKSIILINLQEPLGLSFVNYFIFLHDDVMTTGVSYNRNWRTKERDG